MGGWGVGGLGGWRVGGCRTFWDLIARVPAAQTTARAREPIAFSLRATHRWEQVFSPTAEINANNYALRACSPTAGDLDLKRRSRA